MVLVSGSLIATGVPLIEKPDLVWVRAFVTCPPVVGLVIVLALPPRLTRERFVASDSLPAGEMARMRLSATSNRTASSFALGFRGRLPDALDRDATFELIRGLGRWRQAVGYDATIRQCNHFQIGPLRVRNLNAFGMAWRS